VDRDHAAPDHDPDHDRECASDPDRHRDHAAPDQDHDHAAVPDSDSDHDHDHDRDPDFSMVSRSNRIIATTLSSLH